MSEDAGDFLGVSDIEFDSRDDFISNIDKKYRLEKLGGGFNIIAAVNNREDPSEFFDLLKQQFNVLERNGDLIRIHTTIDGEPVYSYVFLDEIAPIFLTQANKTDQIPPTIIKFLQSTQDIGRLMLSKREIDETRKRIVSEYDNVIVPYFSAKRSVDEPITAKKRPDTKRSIQYRATDGLETYREMRFNYGVLPRIMTFECPNEFKFKIKEDGTFVHVRGGIRTIWNCLQRQIERVEEVVEYANTGSYGETESEIFADDDKFTVSKPWAVEVTEGISSKQIETLPSQLDDSFWEFSVADYYSQPEVNSFEAEVIDETTHERTTLKSKGNDIRIFPREFTDVDQSLRLYNFITDHFDADCKPKKVV
ncbi:hypothetical protein HISP_14350 [Haloarcula hispanica N601]|uniref:Uncharacterized protein n=2 Tax=Haloarcula hispanica TaxID=51589 RepID=V5TRE3_HALHI|nr:hypothetical protein [Haloarcula hispanica]AEM58403.1 conserved hypothetical protein [Haloarcula hispanica ATCC 33960]AHB67537.1 hypothetical protein HISP_14350 [Haloarcula hispanica N601]QRG24217.1 hypothetical protein HarHp1_105 [Haloarcula virus Harhisp1]